MKKLNFDKLDKITKSVVDKKLIAGAVFHVESFDGSIRLTSADGNMQTDSLFYIASINKLMISAMTLRYFRDGKLNLDDKISKYVPSNLIQGLLILNGHDFSNEITIKHLISHTSGLPCYLIDKLQGKPTVMSGLLSGNDSEWSIEDVVDYTKKLKPKFIPGTNGKASYSDTNFRLMDLILEKIAGKPIRNIFKELIKELSLANTHVLDYNNTIPYSPIYVKDKNPGIELFFASTGQDIITNVDDLMKFLKLFFDGYFYPKEKLKELEVWNNIFFPFKYGIGIQKFSIPRIFSLFKKMPDIIGHCGSTGTIAFYVPQKELFITGCVNQTSSPNIAFQAMIKIINLA